MEIPAPGELALYDSRSQELKNQLKVATAWDRPLRVVQWNLERGYKLQQELDYLQTLDADIVCLQEVDIDNERSGNVNQAKIIAERLGLNGGFVTEFIEIRDPCRSAAQQGGGVHGNTIYSKFDMKFRVVKHEHQPYDWNSDGRFLREPRLGERYTIAAEVDIPGRSPLLVYSAHFECFCGISGRVGQLADLIKDSRAMAEKFPHQLVFGDFNTIGHSLARLSPIFCTDRYRWGSLGMSEPEWWYHHILSWYASDGPKNLLLQHQPLPHGVSSTDDWLLKNTVNPEWWDPFDVRKDVTISNHLGWMQAKADWTFVRQMVVLKHWMGNEDYAMSDHKCLNLYVDFATPEQDEIHKCINKRIATELEQRRQIEKSRRKTVFAVGGLACTAAYLIIRWGTARLR